MASPSGILLIKLVMVLLCAGWVSLWLIKPTELWTRKWKRAEASANDTMIGYSGLDFVVYTFPVIAVAILGFVYLELKTREPRIRQRSSIKILSNPLIVNSYIGILSTLEIISVCLFILFLAWTFYVRFSNDLRKMKPIKSLKLNMWEFKFFRMATRFGLLAEACLALLLLPVLRGMALFQVLGIQFEATVKYHVWLGTAMIFFATLHGAGTLFIWGLEHHIGDEVWKWQKTGRIYLAGELGLVTGLVIWITSLPQIRRRKFEIFYYTHHLYFVFLVLFLFHGGDRHFYMVLPGIFLFGLDKLLRIIQSRPETSIISAVVFPCKAIELTLPKDPRLKYSPTSVIFMKIPIISKLQWHSFSVTSASSTDEETMSVIIKCEGWWTSSLYHLIATELASKAHRRKCIPVAIEGPYGPASMDFLGYDSLLLVAGGIGITPFLSILKEIDSARGIGRSKVPTQIQLIYAVKKSEEMSLLNPILPLILNKRSGQLHLKLELFVTQEDRSNVTLEELLHEFSRVEALNFDTKSLNYPIRGPENYLWRAAVVGISSMTFLVFLICFNHIFLRPAKQGSKQKNPSLVSDFLLICSFGLAITMGSLVAVVVRWKKLRKELLPPFTQKQQGRKHVSVEVSNNAFQKHHIHFRTRPNFQDVFSKIEEESGGGLNIGVLVCGPETMKESVASLCNLNSQGLFAQQNKPFFSFHSLNFSL